MAPGECFQALAQGESDAWQAWHTLVDSIGQIARQPRSRSSTEITAHSIAGALDQLPGVRRPSPMPERRTPDSPSDGPQPSLSGSARSGLGAGASLNPLSARTTPTRALVPCRCGADPPSWGTPGEMACGHGCLTSQPLGDPAHAHFLEIRDTPAFSQERNGSRGVTALPSVPSQSRDDALSGRGPSWPGSRSIRLQTRCA